MAVPKWLLRKLYQKGSLQQLNARRVRFVLVNVLSSATLVGPPRLVINGVAVAPTAIAAEGPDGPIDVPSMSPEQPLDFPKGGRFQIECPGHLLRGANRLHLVVDTDEFGPLEIFVEDRVHERDAGGEEE